MAPRPEELDALFPFHVTGLVEARAPRGARASELTRPKRLTRHASLAGAIVQARHFVDAGTPCWIEGAETATLLEKSKSPATSHRLAGKREVAR